VTERPCPECGATIPVLTGYPDWCDGCGWNLERPPVPCVAQRSPARVRISSTAISRSTRTTRR
jgi:hypothetical protein